MIRVINALLAIVGGVGGALLLYYVLNKLVERLPAEVGGADQAVRRSSCPAVAAIGLFLIYPAIQTIILSFANSASTAWVGLDNYTEPARLRVTSRSRCSTPCCGS